MKYLENVAFSNEEELLQNTYVYTSNFITPRVIYDVDRDKIYYYEKNFFYIDGTIDTSTVCEEVIGLETEDLFMKGHRNIDMGVALQLKVHLPSHIKQNINITQTTDFKFQILDLSNVNWKSVKRLIMNPENGYQGVITIGGDITGVDFSDFLYQADMCWDGSSTLTIRLNEFPGCNYDYFYALDSPAGGGGITVISE